MEIVRKQHYYPSSLIRYYADTNNKVHVYNALAKSNPFQYTHYKNICYHKYTYEAESVDNLLEKKLATFESEINPIISRINKSEVNSLYEASKSEVEKLWRFMWLQYHRTDAGRIKIMSLLDGRKSDRRTAPVSVEEISQFKSELADFNKTFKQEQLLEALLDMTILPPSMTFHICIGEHFITSDNPVIAIMKNKYDHSIDNSQFLMPISPNLCIEFQGKNCNCSKRQYVLMKNEKVHWVNKALINTANYYIISDIKFDVALSLYISFCFNDSDWLKKTEFC